MVTPEGLFTPRRVPPGLLNATGYFQGTMGGVLEGYIDKICLLWVDDIVIWGEAPENILKRLLAILDRQLERGFFAAAHMSVFFRKEIKWCGKILSGQTVSHDPERTQELSELRRPETAGELMQFLQAINWMRTCLPELAEIEAPLRGLLEEGLCNTRRTERVEACRVIDSSEWKDERAAAWDAVRLWVREAVPLNHLKPGFSTMVLPDASDKVGGVV